MVERLEERGAVVLGKSNSPEFGAGGNTFNEVFGETRNPWDVLRTCGGSSGGSAAALAAGQVWLATGSDLGGSLRTPAGFCGVVGIRPSPGRVARSPGEQPFDTLSVEGPMGRTVGDAALMLDAMAGWDPRDPLSLEAPGESFLRARPSDRGCRRGSPGAPTWGSRRSSRASARCARPRWSDWRLPARTWSARIPTCRRRRRRSTCCGRPGSSPASARSTSPTASC